MKSEKFSFTLCVEKLFAFLYIMFLYSNNLLLEIDLLPATFHLPE